MKHTDYIKSQLLLIITLTLGSWNCAWGETTYKLMQVTSVAAGEKYVFVQDTHAMGNKVSNNALQTVTGYKTFGLTGNEDYVWTLIKDTKGFYMKNVSLQSNEYLKNSSSTNIAFCHQGLTPSVWTFDFSDPDAVLIKTGNRFLGYTNSTSYAYKAYSDTDLKSYPHAIKVYKLVTTISLNAACHDSDGKVYGTYSNASAWVVPENLTVAEVGVTDGKLNVKAYASGATVPANTGVMVSAAEGGDYAVALSSATGVSVLGNDNRLRPSGHEGITAEAMEAHDANCLYYRLTMHNGTEIGYWWGAENGAAFALAANKAYLAVPKTTATKGMSMWIEDDTTMAIHTSTNENINEVLYDLTGRRIAKEQKGIHITGGRKVIR